MRNSLVAIFATALLCLTALITPSVKAVGSHGNMEGRVTYNGLPVKGAYISADGQSVTSDSQGRFKFGSLLVQDSWRAINVTVRASGLGTWRLYNAVIIPNDTLRLDVKLSKHDVTLSQPLPGTTKNNLAPSTLSPEQDQNLKPAATTLGSQKVPPGVIRVYVTDKTGLSPENMWSCRYDPVPEGKVVEVPFKDYVKHVLPNEWFASWDMEALRAGAMAVKSYAWYYVSRGGKWYRLGADVMDTTCDQVYNPAVSYESTDQAVESTWYQRLTKNDYIVPAFYRAGTKGDPGQQGSGVMSQWGSQYWATKGKTWDWILHYYYDPVDILPATEADLRIYSGPNVTSTTPTWGEPFNVRVTVKNYGSEPMQLQELYIKLRGPNGEVLDLGGDNNSNPINPGETRTIVKYVPRFAIDYPGLYGNYLLTMTYIDPGGFLAPGLPPGESSTSTSIPLTVVAPSYKAQIYSITPDSPSYYEQTSGSVTVKLKNTGNATWYQNSSSIQNAVRLVTYNDAFHPSRFYTEGNWLSSSRILMQDSLVRPGGIGTFRFKLSGDLPPGEYTEYFRLRVEGSFSSTYRGFFGDQVIVKINVLDDTTPPSIAVNAPSYSTERSSELSFPISWQGVDQQTGVKDYDLFWKNGTDYVPWKTATTSTSATFGNGDPTNVVQGGNYLFRLRAEDIAGNVSSWRNFRIIVPFDDTMFSYNPGWRSYYNPSARQFLHTFHYAYSYGSRATFSFYGRRVAWIGVKGPARGMAEVWIDGSKVATVDLYAPRYSTRTVVFEQFLGTRNARHMITIKVLGKRNQLSTSNRVDIDGLAILR